MDEDEIPPRRKNQTERRRETPGGGFNPQRGVINDGVGFVSSATGGLFPNQYG